MHFVKSVAGNLQVAFGETRQESGFPFRVKPNDNVTEGIVLSEDNVTQRYRLLPVKMSAL